MVIPRKWKVVSGSVTVAVALSSGAAASALGDDEEPEQEPTKHTFWVRTPQFRLADVIRVDDLEPASSITPNSAPSTSIAEASVGSPFDDSVVAASQTEPAVTEVTVADDRNDPTPTPDEETPTPDEETPTPDEETPTPDSPSPDDTP